MAAKLSRRQGDAVANVVWLPEALDDVQRLYDFLLDKSPDAATTAARIILDTAHQLCEHPRLGRPMLDETGSRELFAAHGAGAYVIRYRLTGTNNAIIIRVWHSRESR